MVEVRFRRDSRQRLSSFFASGHAGWAERGDDIVCAAVSAILQAAWLGVHEVAGIAARGERDGGRIVLTWPADARDDPATQAIVKTAALAVERLALQYLENVALIYECDDG